MTDRLNSTQYTRLADIANSNTTKNFGRTFNGRSLQTFLLSCYSYRVFEDFDQIHGVVSVRQDGELGFIIDGNVRAVYKPMVEYVNSIPIPMYAVMQTSNTPMIKFVTRRLGFRVVSQNDRHTVVRREP